MKKNTVILQAIVLTIMLAFSAGIAGATENRPANEVLVMGIGDIQTRDFLVDGVFKPRNIKPGAGYIVITTGSEENLVGSLNISLSATANLNFGQYMDYALVIISFNLAYGPSFQYVTATTPHTIAASVDIDSVFGFVYLGTIVTGVSRSSGVALPATCRLVVNITGQPE